MTNLASKVHRHSLLRMTLYSEITIDSNPRHIWEVLTDFNGYQYWNTSIPYAEGEPKTGTVLRVMIQWPGLKTSSYELEVLGAVPDRELRWLGHFGRTGLMDGDHRFIIESIGEERSKLIQSEHFSGWLVPVFAPWLRNNVLRGFENMSVELKTQVEGATARGRNTH